MTAVLRAEEPSAMYLAQVEPPLVRGFELLATADGGTERIRSLIVSMALNGRLTSAAGRSSPVSGGAWPVVRLSDLAPTFQNGASSRGDVGGVPTTVIRLADITAGEISTANPRVLPIHASDRQKHALRRGDILVIRVNGSADLVGRFIVCRTDMDAIHCDHFIRMRFDPAVIWPEYLRLVGDSARVRGRVASLFVSTAGQKTVNQGHIGSISIALPPVEEQVRIVARVEELMKLCDALEQNGRLADEQHARLTSTLFDTLVASESAHALAENWQRVAKHFDLLLDRPEAIDALEQTILQLAVRGLLVPKGASYEPSDRMQSRVVDGPPRQVDKTLLTTAKAAHAVTDGERNFSAPDGWAWVRIEDICDVQGGIQKTQLRRPVKNHFPYLRVANVQRDRLCLDRIERYELSNDEVEKWALKAGELLVVEGNGSEDEIGRCAVWDGSISPCVFQNHLMRVRPHIPETVEFLKLFLNSPDGTAEMRRLAITTSGLYNLSVGKIRKIPVPLPPPAEQHRIVTRVEELRRLCAQLRERISDARRTQNHLAAALVQRVTNTPNPSAR